MNIEKALTEIHAQPVAIESETKLSVLWEKVRPFVVMLGTIFGKKVRPYIVAFTAAIDKLTANETE